MVSLDVNKEGLIVCYGSCAMWITMITKFEKTIIFVKQYSLKFRNIYKSCVDNSKLYFQYPI